MDQKGPKEVKMCEKWPKGSKGTNRGNLGTKGANMGQQGLLKAKLQFMVWLIFRFERRRKIIIAPRE